MADTATQVVKQADNFRPLSHLKSPDELVRKMKQIATGRKPLETQWKLNMAFYKGRQYAYRTREGAIASLPVEDGEKPRYRVRLVSNQIVTGAHSLLSKYTKTKPRISATPGSGAVSDIKAAQLAEQLFEFWWDDFRLDDKLEEALLWAIITGQGYWKISWDKYANKQLRFTLGPDGQPITDDSLKEAFRAALSEEGIEPKEKVVYLGDVRVEAMSPFDVLLDTTAKTFDECKWAVCIHSLEPEEIKAKWKVDLAPDSVSTPPDMALPFQGTDAAQDKNVRKVYIGYFKPTVALPDGRYVVWVENPNMILEDTKWPYPTHDLPLVKFPGLRTPGQIYDGSPVEQALPLQKELNRTLSQIVEYKNLTIRPRVWAPTGSVRTRLTSEPGGLYEFDPIANMRPEIEKLPTMPPYVFEHLGEISSRLKEIFSLTDVSEGTVPPNVEAGIAIDLLQELSADRLAPTIKLIEKSIERAGQQMLVFAQQYYIEPRLMKIQGTGGVVQVQKFTQADISGGVNIRVETGSGLPRTRAGRQAQIERWIDAGIVPADKAWKYLDVADLKGLAAQMAADEDQAQREIDKLINGEVINPESLQDAQQAVQQGRNPATGQPLQPQDNVESLLTAASLQPLIGENYRTHLDVLSLWMASIEFEAMSPQVRRNAQTHWSQTLDAMLSLPGQSEPGKVNTNLQIKATVGPTVASKILQHEGVFVSPEQMSEPPLETWVSDSVDKPDTDAAGPGQEANQLSQAAATLLDSNAKLADAQVAAQIRHNVDSRAHVTHAQQLGHNDVLQAQKIREQSAKADLAEKKVRESNFRPKPTAPKKR